METDKSWAIAIINDYKSSKLFPETKQEKDVYTRAYMHLCDAIRQDYKERLGLWFKFNISGCFRCDNEGNSFYVWY